MTKNQMGVEKHVGQLRWAEAIVFVYPTWTYGFPAMLKGWFDRVMLPGVSFRLGEDGIARPNLQHIKQIIGISTYGRPWWVATFLMGNPPRKNIVRYFKLVTAARARTRFIAQLRYEPFDRCLARGVSCEGRAHAFGALMKFLVVYCHPRPDSLRRRPARHGVRHARGRRPTTWNSPTSMPRISAP